MDTPISLDDLKLYEQNPRRISDDMRRRLTESLTELGDLSGIIRNVRLEVESSGMLLGGNQRTRIFQDHADDCRVVVTDRLDEPNTTGTVAYGYVKFQGERFTYREVDWSDEQVKEACIKANLLGGEWDMEILDEAFNRFDLVDWGFDPMEFPDEVTTEMADGRELVNIAENVDGSEPVYRLNIDGRKVPLTHEEWERLGRFCDEWSARHGTFYGVFNALLEGK